LTSIEDIEVDDEDNASPNQRRNRQRSRFSEDWESGSRAGKAFAAWVQTRMIKPIWRSLIYIQTRIDQVASYSAERARHIAL